MSYICEASFLCSQSKHRPWSYCCCALFLIAWGQDTLTNSARLSDVLKNRLTFLRRLCDQLRLAYPDRGENHYSPSVAAHTRVDLNALLSILLPSGFVADLPWEPGHLRYVLVACNLLHTLLQHPDGVVLLMVRSASGVHRHVCSSVISLWGYRSLRTLPKGLLERAWQSSDPTTY